MNVQFSRHYFQEVNLAIASVDLRKIDLAAKILMRTFKKRRKVFVIGNGGAVATASHLTCDLGKGTLSRIKDQKEKTLSVVSLADNTSFLTAIANDLSFDEVFVQQLRNVLERNDVLIAISASGRSRNVVKAVEFAQKVGAKTIGLLGFGGDNPLAKKVDCPIVVYSQDYGPIEDTHSVICHLLASWFAKIKREEDGVQHSENRNTPFKR